MWLFRFRNYVRFERGLYLRCRQPLYRYAPYAGLDVVPVAVPIARPCAVGDVPDSSRHAPLRDDSHDSRLHGSVSRRRMSDWSRCQWNLPDGYPAYAGYPSAYGDSHVRAYDGPGFCRMRPTPWTGMGLQPS